MKTTTGYGFDKLLEVIPEKQQEIATILIEEIEFLTITLDRLKPEILENSLIEQWNNGKQSNPRIAPQMKLYLDTVQKYKGLLKDLSDLIPATESESTEIDEFMKFISKG